MHNTHASVVALVIAAVPVAFFNVLNQLAALHVLSGADYLKCLKQLSSTAIRFMKRESEIRR